MTTKHKWQAEEVMEYGTKPHVCIKCKIRKMWRGGDYQGWEYIWNETFTAMNGEEGWRILTSWNRPECIEKNKQL